MPLLEESEMTSINTGEEDQVPILNHTASCLHSRHNLVRCSCEDVQFDELEDFPLTSYPNHDVETYAHIHCHEGKPFFSNKRAMRKLLMASIVCLLLVVGEVVGKFQIS